MRASCKDRVDKVEAYHSPTVRRPNRASEEGKGICEVGMGCGWGGECLLMKGTI